MAQVGNIIIDEPRIGCCSPICGGTCPACCDNVVYEDNIVMTFNNAWPATAPDVGWPECTAGSASVAITMSRYYADKSTDPGHEGEWGPVTFHPCSWIWEVGRPMKLSADGAEFTPVCGDYSVAGICVPGGGIPGCYAATYNITRAFLTSLCKVAPQDIDSPYFGMPSIGDGTHDPGLCTVTAGTSKAGWVGDIGMTNGGAPDCLGVGSGICSRTDLINTKTAGDHPGDLEGFRTYGPCVGGSLGCPAWRCCDPFYMKCYLGAYVLNDPMDTSIWPHTRDYIQCEPKDGFPNGFAHIADVDYDLATIPNVEITANHTCTPSGLEMMADIREMSDTRLRGLIRKLLAERARAAV